MTVTAEPRYRVRAFQGLATVSKEDTDDRTYALGCAREMEEEWPDAEITVFDRTDRTRIFQRRPGKRGKVAF